MNENSVVDNVGVLLLEFLPREEDFSLGEFMRSFMNHAGVSRSAKDFLLSASPSRARTDWSEKQPVMVLGEVFKKDPYTEEIKRYADKQGWQQPSFEDALRLFHVISSRDFGQGINSVVVLHKPIRDLVLGITCEREGNILTAHKIESRKKGWYCKKMGFVFRLP
jgi:hypothetical protein